MLILHAKNLSSPHIAHGFFGRTGGVSQNLYASLNCGPYSDDDPAKVIENRRRVTGKFGESARLVTMQQFHSPDVVTVATPWKMENNPPADAMVTKTPGIVLGVLTADCAPVLLADQDAKVIGAAHAGWKGALVGVVEATVAAMEKLGAARGRIEAAIGPCISQPSYEVGADFRAEFTNPVPHAARFFIPGAREGLFQFDLEGFTAWRLTESRITNVERLSACTFAREDDFFSFRRSTLAGEPDYGREISAIMLTE